jgi:hypothetical protein
MSDENTDLKVIHPGEDSLNEYLDGYLADDQKIELENHLETCAQCASRLAELREVFQNLESLPNYSLDRDLSVEVVSAIQPRINLSPGWKWGAFVQFVLAFIVILLAVPVLLETWKPNLTGMQYSLIQMFSERWIALLAQWSTLSVEFQLVWSNLVTEWNPPSILETSQVVIWPIFLSAILLFIVGNGLVLRRITRNGIH